MLTDPIADMLTRIRNANKAMHDTAEMPTSRIKEEIARVLKDEGYIKDFRVVEVEGQPYSTLVVELKFGTQPPARDHGRQARLAPRPPRLRAQGPSAARPRRARHRDPVHLDRPDHEPPSCREAASAAK